jgi:hypothetical protein
MLNRTDGNLKIYWHHLSAFKSQNDSFYFFFFTEHLRNRSFYTTISFYLLSTDNNINAGLTF